MFLDNNSNKDVDTKDEDEVNKLLGNMIVNNNKGQPITNNNSSKEDVDAKGEDKVNKLLRNIIVNNNKGQPITNDNSSKEGIDLEVRDKAKDRDKVNNAIYIKSSSNARQSQLQ